MPRFVFDFTEGNAGQRDLLGGKGAGLAEMTRIGLHVPPGFTVTTDACRAVMQSGVVPDGMWDEVAAAVKRLEESVGRRFGGGPVPLLLSVRSGAKFSMPGMMDTVLNLGMDDEVLADLISWSGDEHFAWDAYRRFVQMFAKVVRGMDAAPFEEMLADLRRRRSVPDDSALTTADLEEATRRFQALVAKSGGSGIPNDPFEQLQAAVSAVFNSWNNRRARDYRRIHGISDDLGTAANVQTMVFGDLGDDSGTGVCFTRDPSTGEKRPFGDYLPRAQGEDVVAGIRNTLTLAQLGTLHPGLHTELLAVMEGMENHYRDMCDIEFTIERGVLWILQTRIGKRTAPAAVRMAVEMAESGLTDKLQAVRRVEPASLEQLERPRLDPSTAPPPVAQGVAASPGAAVGVAVFDSDRAVKRAHAGEKVILIRPETTPDDIHGMYAAQGILTSLGGKTSHAAVIARGMGKPAVTGVNTMSVDLSHRNAVAGEATIEEGDLLTIDGTSGMVFVGAVPLEEPKPTPDLEKILAWADEIRTLGVWANADTPADAAIARARGAEGIGLARTEHMFLGERLSIVQRIILSEDPVEKRHRLLDLKAMQTADFEGLLEAMDGLPVIVRLLDPPLHEFLPSRLDLEHQIVARVRAHRPTADLESLQLAVGQWEEHNPMLGLRGVRLGLIVPDLYRIQVEAALDSVVRRLERGGDPRLEIMIPLVSTTEELYRMKVMVEEVVAATAQRCGRPLHVPVGTMIELPRAALIAGDIARVADFFSFGTNDLTQMTFGLSRDDAEGRFLREYFEQDILTFDPFQTIDIAGVGRLIRFATAEGRATKPDLKVGVCGEHGGDPASISFCREVGLDYVSCSPPRLRVARLAAAQAELGMDGPGSTV